MVPLSAVDAGWRGGPGSSPGADGTVSASLTRGRPALTPCLAVQLQIEEVSRKLRSGDLGIPANVEERCAPLVVARPRPQPGAPPPQAALWRLARFSPNII